MDTIGGRIFDIRHPTKLYKEYRDTPILPILKKCKELAEKENAQMEHRNQHRCVFVIKVKGNRVCFIASDRHHNYEMCSYELETNIIPPMPT